MGVNAITLALAKKYTDSKLLGYDEFGTPVEMLKKGEYEFEGGCFDFEGSFTKNDVLTIVLDGKTYTCYPKEFNGGVFVGNASVLGLEDTGEPFIISYGGPEEDGGNWILVMMIYEMDSESTYHTISITKTSFTTHKIDSRFLPNTRTELSLKELGLIVGEPVEVDADAVSTFMRGFSERNLFILESIETNESSEISYSQALAYSRYIGENGAEFFVIYLSASSGKLILIRLSGNTMTITHLQTE